MVDIAANGMRLLTFEDNQSAQNAGVLVNECEFIDISRTLPEFPDKLQDIIAIEDVALKLKDALHYEDGFARLSYVRLTAPVCAERYLWLFAESQKQKGLYLHALRGIVGHNAVLPAPFGSGLNFIPHIIFMCGKKMHDVTISQALGGMKAFTLMNLGIMAPDVSPNPVWRGLASQFERFSAAGPWLMLYDSPAFFKNKSVNISRNGQVLAEIKLERRKEFAFEGMRFHDLRRWNQGFERQPQKYIQPGEIISVSSTDHHWLYPVPQHEMNANSLPKDYQNPGY